MKRDPDKGQFWNFLLNPESPLRTASINATSQTDRMDVKSALCEEEVAGAERITDKCHIKEIFN
jgi:hypothetical protein